MTTNTRIKRHPLRGAIFGLMLGISAAYFLYFQFAVFGFDTVGGVLTRFVIIIVVGMVVGVIWAYVAPPRKPKDAPPPVSYEEAPPAAAYEEPAAPEAPPAQEWAGSEETFEPEEAWKPAGTEDGAAGTEEPDEA